MLQIILGVKYSKTFLPRDTILARYMPSSCVCLSVSLSVTLGCCIKKAKRRITQIMSHDSIGKSSDAKDHGEIRTGSPPTGATNGNGVG